MIKLKGNMHVEKVNKDMDLSFYLKEYAPDERSMEEYGFLQKDGKSVFTKKIEGSLYLVLTLAKDGFTAKVWDDDFGGEYLPFNFEDEQNPVRAKAEEIIADVIGKCFVCLNVRSNIVDAMEKRYGVLHEAPWEDDPDSITFKTRLSKKWFAIMMRIPADRLGLKGRNLIDVANIKLPPDKINALIDNVHYFRAYHMNKTHWLSVKLDKDSDISEFLSLAEISYSLAEKKNADNKQSKKQKNNIQN